MQYMKCGYVNQSLLTKSSFLSLSQYKVSQESILLLGQSREFKCGKMMIHPPWKQADQVWQQLVDSLFKGILSESLGVLYIKVSGRSDQGN